MNDDDDDISNIESRFFATVKSQIAASTRQQEQLKSTKM